MQHEEGSAFHLSPQATYLTNDLQTLVVSAVHPQKKDNRFFIHAGVRAPFVTSTRIGMLLARYSLSSPLTDPRRSLTTWLAHSKKKSCDVCKYQYSFTKGVLCLSYLSTIRLFSLPILVYSPNMPKQLPFVLFLRKFAKQLMWGALLVLRGLMVSFIWLAFLPYITVWTWRFYFIVGDNM